jgi:5'(3')-deoxyribonucleotidase
VLSRCVATPEGYSKRVLIAFIPDKNIVFCGDKSIIRADFMIDDSVPNLKAFTGQGIVFTAPHNALDADFPRVNRWLDVADYFEVTETFL